MNSIFLVIDLLFGEQKHKNIEITNAVALTDNSIQNIKIDSESIREFESFGNLSLDFK